MYRNTVGMHRGDRLSFQSNKSFSRGINHVFAGNYVGEAVPFKSGSGKWVEATGDRCRTHFTHTRFFFL